MTTESMAAQTEQLQSIIGNVDRVVLTTADLDGDSVGAIVSMWDFLSQSHPNVPLHLYIESALPERYAFLVPTGCNFEVVSDQQDWSDAFVLVMDSEPKRFKCLAPVFWSGKYHGVIDHHQKVDPGAYDFALYDSEAPSTTTLIYGLYLAKQLVPSLSSAVALYAGLVFDTSVFRYKLTSPFSLRMAAHLTELGVDHTAVVERLLLVQPLERVRLRALVLSGLTLCFSGRLCLSTLNKTEAGGVDSGGLVDDLIFIDGVEVAALCVEISRNRIRISLRSRSEMNVAEVAQALHATGGGHRRAAGVTLNCDMDEALKRLHVLIQDGLEDR